MFNNKDQRIADLEARADFQSQRIISLQNYAKSIQVELAMLLAHLKLEFKRTPERFEFVSTKKNL